MSEDHIESILHLRTLRPEDYEAVRELQEICFPGMAPWTREQFESQIATFPEGQIGLELDGRLIASSSSLIILNSDYSDLHEWMEIADDGMIRNHDPEGDTLYGIEIMVHPDARGRRLARRMYEARKEICRARSLARMAAGGRIPGYAKHQAEMTAQEYVDAVISRDLVDPVLTPQLANGFELKHLIPDYLPSDEDSAGYATSLEWMNPDYVPPSGRVLRRQVVDTVRIACVQYQLRPLQSFDDFSKQCEFFVDSGADVRADFVVFPELFTLHLLSLVKSTEAGQGARRLASFTDQYVDLFADLAVRYDVNIQGGTQFVVEDGKLLNVAFLFHRDGRISRQPKLHPTPSERRWWGVQGGDRLDVIETDRGPVAILICYDAEFPELGRIVTQMGATMIFVPYNTQDRIGHTRVRTCTHARCIENGVYAALAGCVGNLPFVDNADTHYAQSAILTPSDVPFARDGIAAEASPNIETILFHDVDLQLVRRYRRGGAVRPWADRRRDLYTVRWHPGNLEF